VTKPDDIPQDVWDVARKETGGWMAAGESESNDALVKSVARAILAERERCAVVAYAEAVKHCSARDGQTLIGHPVGHSIAAAIRKGE
jgi:hypothetical protein